MEIKYFLDPVCGYGNTVEVYINNRLPEIIDEFESREAAVRYICEHEIYMFNYKNIQDSIEAKHMFKQYGVNNTHVYHINWDENNVDDYFKLIISKLKKENYKNIDKNGMPKFDYIIQNPPYKRSLHLDFFESALDMLSSTGKMVIIEPSTWLIDIRNNKRTEKFNLLKNKIENHVKSVNIENLNREFNICLSAPCSITTIDMSKTYDTVDFSCCGEHKTVHSIYDCNLIGDYNMIHDIINKCLSYKDMMVNHIYKENKTVTDEHTYYTKYSHILSVIGCIFSAWNNGNTYESNKSFKHHKLGEYMSGYISSSYHTNYNEIANHIIKAVKRGSTNGTTGNKDAACLYGTKEELENWKYYVYNNKLPLFLNIMLNYDQANKSREFIPWLVDKQYTDAEIYDLLGITKEEQELIDATLVKFERYSPWFKRYSDGK